MRGKGKEREWRTRQGNEVSYTDAGKIIWGKKGDQQGRERRNGEGNGQTDKNQSKWHVCVNHVMKCIT